MALPQEVKQLWLEALRSGKFKRATGILHYHEYDGELSEVYVKHIGMDKIKKDPNIRHCCIGVLQCIHPDAQEDPYEYLTNIIGGKKTEDVWRKNDSISVNQSDGYEMVIPLIEQL